MSGMPQKPNTFNFRQWLYLLVAALGVGVLLSSIDKQGISFDGVLAYSLIAAIAAAALRIGWISILKFNPPTWVQIALVTAVALRLALGVGLFTSLPRFGYPNSKPNSTGYIYQDAYERDKDAWRFANSNAPLFEAWAEADLSDQYGGLHFTSTVIYRTLSLDEHRPLLVVILTATFGSLAVLYTWSSSKRLFGDRVAMIATWFVVFYPEAVLLSASQMREPFLITALALGLHGYSLVRAGEFKAGLTSVFVAALIALALSPPFSVVLIAILVFAWVWEGKLEGRQKMWAYTLIGVLGIAGAVLTVRGWSNIPGSPGGNVFQLLSWWITSGAEYQLHLLTEASGWVQKVFELVPEWSHMPLAVIYGLVQPFFPAALMDSSSLTLIRVIVSFRAAGWFFTLPFLLYAPFLALKSLSRRNLIVYLILVFSIAVVVVSYRDAGRMWDNPRWRAIFLSLQAIVVAWVWVKVREGRDPWLRRIAVVVGFATLAFLHWEAGRYYQTPRLNLWKTLGLVGGFALLFLAGSFLYDRFRDKKIDEN